MQWSRYRTLLVTATAVGCFGLFTATASPPKEPVSRKNYVGDSKCLSCHQDKQSYLGTAHHLTSTLPTKETIGGSFTPGENVLKTSNPDLAYKMEATTTGFTETAIIGTPPSAITQTEPIDLVIGSGRKGRTFLYWKGDRLFELPVSYWIELKSWANSPGYQDNYPNFERPVPPRCLECHATYFDAQGSSNIYKKTGFVLGISCERCHGPGLDHVARHEASGTASNQAAPKEEAIVNPAKLPRERQIETCAVCHEGIGVAPLAPAFSYIPGQPLRDYINLGMVDPNAKIDVHGNQVALLERSRCFQSSSTMTCFTCHNVHVAQRDAPAFSQHCLGCHKVDSCGEFAKSGAKIAGNCIDCHMPRQKTNLIISSFQGREVRPEVRSHWIKVYPETSAEKSSPRRNRSYKGRKTRQAILANEPGHAIRLRRRSG